jgi:hypothetical protein
MLVYWQETDNTTGRGKCLNLNERARKIIFCVPLNMAVTIYKPLNFRYLEHQLPPPPSQVTTATVI